MTFTSYHAHLFAITAMLESLIEECKEAAEGLGEPDLAYRWEDETSVYGQLYAAIEDHRDAVEQSHTEGIMDELFAENETDTDDTDDAEENQAEDDSANTDPPPAEVKPTYRARSKKQHEKRVRELQSQLSENIIRQQQVTRELKHLKEDQKEIGEELEELGNYDGMLPLDDADAVETAPVADAKATPTEPVVAGKNEAWKLVLLTKLDISAGVLRLLEEADFTTIEHISRHTATGQALTTIPKIGQAKADQIETALEKFWREHPEYCK